jgi:ABC-type multidrug transport system fused ATPase/permease subunit
MSAAPARLDRSRGEILLARHLVLNRSTDGGPRVPADEPAPEDDGVRSDLDRGSSKGTLRRGIVIVARGVRREKLMFGLAVGGAAVYGTGTAAGGWVLGRVTDRIIAPAFEAGQISGAQAAAAGGWLALVAVLTAVGVVVRRIAAGITMYRLQARYRRDVTAQYLRLPLAWHHRHPAGLLLSNANADVEAMWQVMAPLPMSLGVVIMIFVAGLAMIVADPVLAVVGLLVIPAIIAVNAAYQRRMSPIAMQAQRLRGDVSAVAHESFEAATVVKTLGREAAETHRFEASAHRLRDANVAVGRLRGIFDPVVEALPTLGILLVLAVGTYRVDAGASTAADVVQVTYLLTILAFPVRATGWVLGELPRTVVGWERISAVLEARGGMAFGDAKLGDSGPAALRVDGVDYAHTAPDGGPVPVLHGVTLDVEPGRTVAVVGPTGSGKSTLASLLVRLVDPADGRVLVDGADVRALRAGGLAAAAAIAPQGTFVFDDSVRGNVTLGADFPPTDPHTVADAVRTADGVLSGDDERVWRALELVRADGFVRALPEGLDTRVGERGATLSGGQRQRLALARAVIREPRLLVLDDATSAIDPHVEAEILDGLRRAGDRTTVVVVAYRRATIALADEVVYVEQGRVLDRGRHEELLERSAGYRALVTAYDAPGDDEEVA